MNSGVPLTLEYVRKHWRTELAFERSPTKDRDVTFMYEQKWQLPDACLCCTTFVFDNERPGETQFLHAVVIYHAASTEGAALEALEKITSALDYGGPIDTDRAIYNVHGSWVAYVYYPVAPPNSTQQLSRPDFGPAAELP